MPVLHLGSKSASCLWLTATAANAPALQTGFVLCCQQKDLSIDIPTSIHSSFLSVVSIGMISGLKKGHFLWFNLIFDKHEPVKCFGMKTGVSQFPLQRDGFSLSNIQLLGCLSLRFYNWLDTLKYTPQGFLNFLLAWKPCYQALREKSEQLTSPPTGWKEESSSEQPRGRVGGIKR